MKKIVLAVLVVFFSVLFCEGQNIRNQLEQQQQQEAVRQEQQRQQEATRQQELRRQEETRRQEQLQQEEAQQKALQAELLEQERISKAQLSVENLFLLLKSDDLGYIDDFLSSRGWQFNGANISEQDNEMFDGYEAIEWSFDKENNAKLTQGVFVYYRYQGYESAVSYWMTNEETGRILETELKTNEYKPQTTNVIENGLESVYRKEQYNVTFQKLRKNSGNSDTNSSFKIFIFNFGEIEKLQTEIANEREKAARRPARQTPGRGDISFFFAGCDDLAKEEHGNISLKVSLKWETGKMIDGRSIITGKPTRYAETKSENIGSGTLGDGFSFLIKDPNPGGKKTISIEVVGARINFLRTADTVGDAVVSFSSKDINTNLKTSYDFTVSIIRQESKKGEISYRYQINLQ